MAAVSPELALVDRELRELAVAALPRVQPFDFLRFDTAPRRHFDLGDFEVLAGRDESETLEWAPPVWVAATVYAVTALAKVIAVDAMFVVVIAAAIAFTQFG